MAQRHNPRECWCGIDHSREASAALGCHVDLDGIHIGGHAWLRISIRLPRRYALRVEHKRTHPRYSYRVVTMNGHGVHGPTWQRAKNARKHAKRLAAAERPPERFKLGPYEIERIEHVTPGQEWPRRYWMRERRWWCPLGRWVPQHYTRDEAVRRPDWIYS